MLIPSGLAAQAGLHLLSAAYALWSTRSGKIAIGAVALAAGLWLAVTLMLTRAYDRGVAETQGLQEAVRQEAITAARAEAEIWAAEIERASAGEQAALRELQSRNMKVRKDDETADRVLLPADDSWLRAKAR